MKYLFNILIIIFLVHSFCKSSNAESKFKVGVIAPLSGPLAEFGHAMSNGIELAKSEVPRLSNIQLVIEDSLYSPQVAITLYRKFQADPDIKLIINFGCPTSQAISSLAETAKIPTLVYCSSDNLTKDKNYTIGMTPPASDWASILFQHLAKKQYQNLCVILTDNDYLVSEYSALSKHVENNKGLSLNLIDRYLPSDNDFKSSILKIKNKNCDALGVYLLPGQVQTFLRSLKSLVITLPVFGTDIFESTEEIKMSQGMLENAVFVSLKVPESFHTTYSERFNSNSQITAGCVTYDLISRISEIVIQNPSLSNEELLNTLKTSKREDSRCGGYQYLKNSNNESFFRFPLSLKSIKDSEIVIID